MDLRDYTKLGRPSPLDPTVKIRICKRNILTEDFLENESYLEFTDRLSEICDNYGYKSSVRIYEINRKFYFQLLDIREN